MNMIERVADAISNAGMPLSKKDSLKRARAAIEAMRCPPEDIIWAGAEELTPGTSYVDAQDVWHSMISAALNEERSTAMLISQS